MGIMRFAGCSAKAVSARFTLRAILAANELCALKTFKGELMSSLAVRRAFRKEALIWIHLDQHPHIISARSVDYGAGRVFVHMEYVPRDAMGRSTLSDHLASAGNPTSGRRWPGRCNFALPWNMPGTAA